MIVSCNALKNAKEMQNKGRNAAVVNASVYLCHPRSSSRVSIMLNSLRGVSQCPG